MIDIQHILSLDNPEDIINSLKERTTNVPSWSYLDTLYNPTKHKIATDTVGRRDKIHQDGTKDEAARLYVGLEKLLTSRMNAFTFATPVKRIYTNTDTPVRKEIARAIENIYDTSHIDTENLKRGKAYFASCEFFTIWYTKKSNNYLYGFPSKYKLKCKTFSPMDNVRLFPLIDESGDMVAMSYEYNKKVKDTWVSFFECYTADKHYVWENQDGDGWTTTVNGDEIVIGKIPAVYVCRKEPIWEGLSQFREDLEYNLSRDSDVVAYNSAPILKVAGSIIGEETKGETRRIYRVTEGGDVSYVSWNQSQAALDSHVRTLLNLFWSGAQMPDISFDNMRGLGNIGFDARKTLFADAHLKVKEESGPLLEALEREGNVIKAFLKKLNTAWSEEDIDAVRIQHIITPFIIDDDNAMVETWMKACGGKPVISQREAVQKAGFAENYEDTIKYIEEDEAKDMAKMLAMSGAKG